MNLDDLELLLSPNFLEMSRDFTDTVSGGNND